MYVKGFANDEELAPSLQVSSALLSFVTTFSLVVGFSTLSSALSLAAANCSAQDSRQTQLDQIWT